MKSNKPTVDKEATPNAELFLKKKISTYAWGTPFGLNKLPIVLYEEVAKVMDEYAASLRKENDELKEWKRQSILVTPPLQEIGKAIDVRLGESIHDKILPAIIGQNKKLDYWKQRCEAAEKLIHGEAYIHWPKELSEWRRIKHYESNPGQLKNQDI